MPNYGVEPDAVAYSILISSKKAVNAPLEDILQIANLLKQNKLILDDLGYTQLIHCYNNAPIESKITMCNNSCPIELADKYKRIIDLHREMMANRIASDGSLYSVILNAYLHHLNSYTPVIEDMKSNSVKPSLFLFNQAALYFAKKGDIEEMDKYVSSILF
jgi:hypothetical protein